jgi:hypothetical protein
LDFGQCCQQNLTTTHLKIAWIHVVSDLWPPFLQIIFRVAAKHEKRR